MRIGIFTTATRPEERGDNYEDAIRCYKDLADEVVTVRGEETWPQEFDWQLIGQHFQHGYEQCNTDWVIHADLDFIFHEKDFDAIRQACIEFNDEPAFSMLKYQFILPDRYAIKSRLVVAVNKGKYGNKIRFDSGGDLCQPSLNGFELKPSDVPSSNIPFYNYEKMTKTSSQVMDDVGRMARAWMRCFGAPKLGVDAEDAFNKWMEMMKGRFGKTQYSLPFGHHPKYVQDTIRNLKESQWGYSGFGALERNSYA